MKFKILLYLLFVLLSCEANRMVELADDKIVNTHFNEDEITYLTSLLDYVDTEIRRLSTIESSLKEQYHEFFNILKSEAETNPYGELSKFDVQRFNLILEGVPQSFLNEIWYVRSEESGYEVGLIRSGKFAGFLENAAESNPFIINYSEALNETAGIAPSMYASIILEPERLNIELERERLVLAIHYITIFRENILNQKPDSLGR